MEKLYKNIGTTTLRFNRGHLVVPPGDEVFLKDEEPGINVPNLLRNRNLELIKASKKQKAKAEEASDGEST